LGAVRLVDHDDDVVATVQDARGLSKLVDGRDDHFARVLGEHRLEFSPRVRRDSVRHIGGVEGGCDLCVEIDPVDDDEHRWVMQILVKAELLRGEDHEQ